MLQLLKNCRKFISNKSDAKIFHELRYELYHSNSFKSDLEKLLLTTTSIVKYIKCGNYCYVWMNGTFLSNIDNGSLEYS